MFSIRAIQPGDFEEIRHPLATLLCDVVVNGASVGFVLPLSHDEAIRWVDSLRVSVESGQRLIWVAEQDRERGEHICGSVQLDLCTRPNGVNRAEVQKLLVHSQARRIGVGQQLMSTLEESAKALGRGLLYLDTEAKSPAEAFYRSLGYRCIGGLPEYACSPEGEWRSNAIYYKTLFLRNPK